jgi:hypothetical protein
LLKRSINGTYVSVEPFHLFRYVDEQAFRSNNRKVKDGDRFNKVLGQVVDRRVTYKELTGKVGETECLATSARSGGSARTLPLRSWFSGILRRLLTMLLHSLLNLRVGHGEQTT